MSVQLLDFSFLGRKRLSQNVWVSYSKSLFYSIFEENRLPKQKKLVPLRGIQNAKLLSRNLG